MILKSNNASTEKIITDNLGLLSKSNEKIQ